jgi:hypothetical protein
MVRSHPSHDRLSFGDPFADQGFAEADSVYLLDLATCDGYLLR